ncbi:MAG: hypothetical protein HOV67_35495 [Kribbellaceae bacterium]|nr:hypothetical protein [Kribbellaceae bacterium]
MSWWMYLLSSAGAAGLVGAAAAGLVRLAREIRLTIRDIGDRRLARHVFDQTRGTKAVEIVLDKHHPKQLVPDGDGKRPSTDDAPKSDL